MRSIVLLASMSLLCSGGTVTHRIGADFTSTSPTLGTPIPGFDPSLGQFESATVKLIVTGSGSFGYYCPGAPDGVTCGDFEWDPVAQEWVVVAARPYTGNLPWRADVRSEVYDAAFSRYWESGGGFDRNGRCDDQACYLDATLTIVETTADPVFTLSPQLYWDLRTDIVADLRDFFSGGYASTAEASYFGGATLEVTYSYNPVPEPAAAPVCAAGLLGMALTLRLKQTVRTTRGTSGITRYPAEGNALFVTCRRQADEESLRVWHSGHLQMSRRCSHE